MAGPHLEYGASRMAFIAIRRVRAADHIWKGAISECGEALERDNF